MALFGLAQAIPDIGKIGAAFDLDRYKLAFAGFELLCNRYVRIGPESNDCVEMRIVIKHKRTADPLWLVGAEQ